MKWCSDLQEQYFDNLYDDETDNDHLIHLQNAYSMNHTILHLKRRYTSPLTSSCYLKFWIREIEGFQPNAWEDGL